MRSRDTVWTHVVRVNASQRCVCSHCETELGRYPANIKEHTVSMACWAIEDAQRRLRGEMAGWSKGTAGCANETRNTPARDMPYTFTGEAAPTNGAKSSRSTVGGLSAGVKAGQPGALVWAGGLEAQWRWGGWWWPGGQGVVRVGVPRAGGPPDSQICIHRRLFFFRGAPDLSRNPQLLHAHVPQLERIGSSDPHTIVILGVKA